MASNAAGQVHMAQMYNCRAAVASMLVEQQVRLAPYCLHNTLHHLHCMLSDGVQRSQDPLQSLQAATVLAHCTTTSTLYCSAATALCLNSCMQYSRQHCTSNCSAGAPALRYVLHLNMPPLHMWLHRAPCTIHSTAGNTVYCTCTYAAPSTVALSHLHHVLHLVLQPPNMCTAQCTVHSTAMNAAPHCLWLQCRTCTIRSILYCSSPSGLSEAPKPGRSGAITRCAAAARCEICTMQQCS
jgi:hypothetical protein